MRALGDAAFAHPRAVELCSAASTTARWVAFEAALARAGAAAGVVPPDAADAVAAACAGAPDPADLAAGAASEGTPVIALVGWLRDRVDPEVRPHVHRGATSQDVLDTATVLLLREILALVEGELERIGDRAEELTRAYRGTATLGRTLLQPAVPIPFGLKTARWAAWARRRRAVLAQRRRDDLVLQFGGAAGALSALGDAGPAVARALARELDLRAPAAAWHAERDRLAETCGALAVTAGGAATIATDLVLLAQGEVAETAPGAPGGSSAMPHKRNPVDAVLARGAARLASAAASVVLAAEHEHERAAGAWQAEWVAVPDLARYAAGAVWRVRRALEGLVVDPERMRANLREALGERGSGETVDPDAAVAPAGALIDGLLAEGSPAADPDGEGT